MQSCAILLFSTKDQKGCFYRAISKFQNRHFQNDAKKRKLHVFIIIIIIIIINFLMSSKLVPIKSLPYPCPVEQNA